jgi:S-(hydroxymethyl)glutathione dehydrogenase/alcohol dehydrogenase
MKAAILQRRGELDLVDLVIDKPAPHEVLIRTVGSGLCHSDLHAIDSPAPRATVLVPGHEASGIVEQVGSDVTYVKPGDHVITFLVQFCGACEYCLDGHPTICSAPVGARPAQTNPRLTYNGAPVAQFANLGGFAEQMLVHEHAVAKINPEYPLDRAAVIGCGVCTGLGSVLKSARVRPGSTVAVVGGGGVGLSAVQGARIAGARRIFLVDIQPEKFDLARKAGATDCIDPANGDPVQQIRDLTGGGVDFSFECLGLKQTCEQAVQMLRPAGLATIIGLGGDFSVGATFLLRGERKVQGAFMGSNNFRTDMAHYMELDLQGRLDVASLIESHIKLEDINDGYEAMRQRQIQGRRVIMFPQ